MERRRFIKTGKLQIALWFFTLCKYVEGSTLMLLGEITFNLVGTI